jgi:peptidoglycan/LPS O-acetylase OafA/YrhL
LGSLFFVLSGFLVGAIAWRKFKAAPAGSPWAKSYLMRRWLRTLPNYYLFLTVNVLLVACAIVPGHVTDLLSFLVFAQNLAWPHPPVFGEAWSLAVEEVFYLAFPLSLLVLGSVISAKRTALLAATAMLVLAPLSLRFMSVTLSDPTWDEGVRKVVLFRLDALMFGVLAGWLSYEYQLPKQIEGAALLAIGTAILLPAIWFFFSVARISTGAILLGYGSSPWYLPGSVSSSCRD